MKKEIRKLPAGHVKAVASAKSINLDRRTVDLTWSTGSKGLRNGWDGPFYEELSLKPEHVDLTRLSDGSHPLLAAHNDKSLDAVIGVVERVWLENGKAAATVRFANDDISDRVFQKVKDGILKNVSVGYSVERYEETSSEHDEYPTFLATRWTPAELSIVPIGFDVAAKIRTEAPQTNNEVEIFYHRSKSEGNVLDMEDNNIQNDSQSEVIEQPKKESRAVIAERNRVMAIRKAVKDASWDDKTADEWIENGASIKHVVDTIAEFKRFEEQNLASQIIGRTRVDINSDNESKKRELLVEALTHRICPEFQPSRDARQFQGQSIIRSLEQLYHRPFGETDVAFAKRAMSSSDFPILLSNVAEKSLQQRYRLQPRSFDKWVKRDSLRNYKEYTQARAGDYPALLELAENSEYHYGAFGEEKESVSLKRYGRIVSFSHVAIVNDDMSALQQVSNEGGVAAARLENQLVYDALLTNKTMADGIALYHASHGNLGTPGAISDTTAGEAYKLMRKQLTVDKLDTFNVPPAFLICGPDKEQEARKYLAAINPTQSTDVNVYSGLLELVVDSKITGNQYYFAASPSVLPSIVLFHLEGQEAPTIESRHHFETDSFQLKVAHNAVAAPMDWRGLVKNAGT